MNLNVIFLDIQDFIYILSTRHELTSVGFTSRSVRLAGKIKLTEKRSINSCYN